MIGGIVLAAGTSSRLGRPKQLLDLSGRPVLQWVLDAARASALDDVVVVLGHAAREIQEAVTFDQRVRPVMNPDFAQGQSTSLRAGLGALAEETEAAVIMLADQPGLRPDAIDAVIGSWRRKGRPVVQASYSGKPAHPTLLARQLWPELAARSGDEGARGFIASRRSSRTLVEVGGRPPDDIDTEEDYRRVLSQQPSIEDG
jgi:molybdenum cofactor cytidylyltransferase